MKFDLPLPQDKKLTVIFRIEPGCLGPDGESHIDDFCNFAQKEVESIDADFVHWILTPRKDKNLPEMQYQVSNKILTHDKADRYLDVFEKSLDEFEAHLHDGVTHLIDQYLGH